MRLIEPQEAVELKDGPIPKHVAIVMDGNGRWALYRGLTRTDGHYAAKRSLFDCIDVAIELQISWLSFYVFSTENWKRPRTEVDVLLDFARWALARPEVESLARRGVRFRFSGNFDDDRLPASVLSWFRELEEVTKDSTGLQIVVAFNYGGQDEIVHAARRAIELGLNPAKVDAEVLSSLMYIPSMPAVDLFIRTSGEHRVSNFFLWHIAYAELVFTDTLWPDFGRGHLQSAIADFQTKRRRFGNGAA